MVRALASSAVPSDTFCCANQAATLRLSSSVSPAAMPAITGFTRASLAVRLLARSSKKSQHATISTDLPPSSVITRAYGTPAPSRTAPSTRDHSRSSPKSSRSTVSSPFDFWGRRRKSAIAPVTLPFSGGGSSARRFSTRSTSRSSESTRLACEMPSDASSVADFTNSGNLSLRGST